MERLVINNMNKIFNKKGETIVETLVAILIVAICFLMLQTSVVASARINKTSSEENVPFNMNNPIITSCSITVNGNTVSTRYTCKVTSDGEYYYYDD